MDAKELLKNYINRILELQDKNQSHAPLSEEELKKVALELGLNEGELAFIDQEIEDHKQRGKGFASYENWEDAIEEFKQALTLKPIDQESLGEISRAHYELWKAKSKGEDKEKAISYARNLLDLDPSHEPSLKMISDLKATAEVPRFVAHKGGGRPTAFLAIIALVLFIAIAAGIFVLTTPEAGQPNEQMGQKSDSKAETQSANIPSTPETPNTPEVQLPSQGNLGVSVEVFNENYEEAFEIIVLSSNLVEYEASFSYKAHGYLVAKQEIDELKVMTTLHLSTNAIPLPPKEFSLIQSHEANARPGDKIPWDMLIYHKGKFSNPIENISIQPSKVKLNPNISVYPDAREKGEVLWDVPQPEGHELLLRERKLNINNNSLVKKAYARIELELENKGLASYKLVKLKLVWKGKGMQKESTTYALAEQFPFLVPGQKIAFGGTYEIGEEIASDFSGYEVHVIEWN
ncbi:MAG: hypothetical protein MRZ79_16810 [Bacteroidia bacterium]|nr:hypothetical protein [Bacteroidia bacterium]